MVETNKNSQWRSIVFFMIFILVIGVILFINKDIIFYQQEAIKQENKLEETSEIPVAKNDWQAILVNNDNSLPVNWELKMININNVATLKKEKINKNIINQFDKWVKAAQDHGIELLVISAYRSVSAQKDIYNGAVSEYQSMGYSKAEAIKETEKTINRPGASEHHTGLAIDIVGLNAWNNIGDLDSRLADTKEFKWLEANAYQYGFILRYPKDKVNITKVNYEPWHFRYVGVELATYLTKNHLTLEEYHNKK